MLLRERTRFFGDLDLRRSACRSCARSVLEGVQLGFLLVALPEGVVRPGDRGELFRAVRLAASVASTQRQGGASVCACTSLAFELFAGGRDSSLDLGLEPRPRCRATPAQAWGAGSDSLATARGVAEWCWGCRAEPLAQGADRGLFAWRRPSAALATSLYVTPVRGISYFVSYSYGTRNISCDP